MMEWGASEYPIRYIALNSLIGRCYISPLWSEEKLEIIADARRVLGYAGTSG